MNYSGPTVTPLFTCHLPSLPLPYPSLLSSPSYPSPSLFLQVVNLASPSFHYHLNDRCQVTMRRFATEVWPDTIGKRVSSDLPLKVTLTAESAICIPVALGVSQLNVGHMCVNTLISIR